MPFGTDPLISDTDGDLLSDGQEVNTYGTDPLNADSDTDGFRDGIEVANGSDPLNPLSVPQLNANGDINLDGNNNAADILIAQRYVLGLTALTAEQIARGDLYPPLGDGVISLSDLLLITKQVMSLP